MELAKSAAFWLLGWLLAAALWMVLVDTTKLPELWAGALVAAVGATGAELVRRQRVGGIGLHPLLAARSWRVLVRAVPDVGRLTMAAFGQLAGRKLARGRVVAIPFPHGGDEPRENAVRALALGLGSFAPNTIVIGVDPDEDRLIAHQLVPTRDSSDLDPLRLR